MSGAPICGGYGCVAAPAVIGHVNVPTDHGPVRAYMALCDDCARTHLLDQLDTPTEAVA